MMSLYRRCIFLLLFATSWSFRSAPLHAVEPAVTTKSMPPTTITDQDDLAGHSYHGEAFDEGPRQAATLIDGLSKIEFPTSTKNKQAQQFFEQGVAQLHGFWYLEAERSFRQAAKLDPSMAIAYWGMAMANVNNTQRTRGLIDEATAKMQKQSTPKEKLYIEALSRLIPAKQTESKDESKDARTADEKTAAEKETKRKHGERYIADMEKILHQDPADVEAKAFLAVYLWQADRVGVKLTSRYAVNALLSEIFATAPMHPSHHYRIHLWDSARPENALQSAALCGPSMPGVAHMWHMPGHIYSRLHRYHDAAWQQEASARVDHAYMNRARLIPDQIHNFAHNNEWLTRNLLFVGRVNDAVAQATNLISLPRHPQYNSLSKQGSFQYGRTRFIQTCSEYALWDQLIDAANGPLLEPTEDPEAQAERLGWLAAAFFRSGDSKSGGMTLRQLQRMRIELETKLLDRADIETSEQMKAKATGDETIDSLRKRLDKLRPIIARAAAAAATKQKKAARVKMLGEKANLDKLILAQWLADAGDLKGAIEIARGEHKRRVSQVRPPAILADLLWRDNQKAESQKVFQELRTIAADADIDTPLLANLVPVAKSLDIPGDWRIKRKPASDLGERPPLDSLGSAQWQRYQAPSWTAMQPDGEAVSDEAFSGKPCIVIFYLGFGCLHCVEQLHAFEPKTKMFQKAGIEVLGISNEDAATLKSGLDNFEQPINIPLFADSEQEAFKAFRCWDDFENQPLHGTFLLDKSGRVCWQDIGHEPFTDVGFLLDEAQRLLKLP